MATTVSIYNHTTALFGRGENFVNHTYKLMLCTAATFNANDTNILQVNKTEAVGTGYTAGGQALSNVAVYTYLTNDAIFYADPVTWTFSAGFEAAYAVLYNATDIDLPCLLFIDFGGTKVAGFGSTFVVNWSNEGVFRFIV